VFYAVLQPAGITHIISEEKEDMTIPIFLRHSTIAPGTLPENINIVDIAPTITSILGVDPDPDWEGKSLL
jgi:arylsulfatase A-like enzyme